MKKIYILFLFALAANFSFSQVSVTTYSWPGTYTYTIPTGVTTLSMEIFGAGGKGQGNGTGGGGGGGYSFGVFSVIPGSTLAVTIGTPGVSPAAGTSSITGYISATGGANGVSVANPNVGGGGAGGVGSGGSVNFTGGTGGGGYYTYFGGVMVAVAALVQARQVTETMGEIAWLTQEAIVYNLVAQALQVRDSLLEQAAKVQASRIHLAA